MSETTINNSLVPDLNGDGRADLILVDSQFMPVVRYGRADGTFSASTPLVSFALQIEPAMVLAGDLNGDGFTDLILFGSQGAASAYQVLLNDGTGHFSASGSGTLPNTDIAPVVAGDFNHDGKLDFAFGSLNGGLPFSLFLGNGDGTFGTPVTVGASTGLVPISAGAADLNDDGYTDIVYAAVDQFGGNQLRILLSGTGGSYTDSQFSQLPNGTLGFVIGDFNNDHIPDIFATDTIGMGVAYLGAGNGTFTATGNPIFASDGYLYNQPFVTGDFDDDSNADVSTRLESGGPDQLLFLWGDGKGNFSSHLEVSDHSFSLEVGDVNGDGIADIFAGVTAGFAYPSVVLGRNNRNFPSAQTLLPANWGILSTGDVFNDGFTDLLVGGADDNGSPGTPGTIYHSAANGTLAPQGQAPGYSTVLADLNGDGIPDMVGLSGNTLLIWKGDGTGFFGPPINQISVPDGFQTIYFRDMDGDGYIDIVLPAVILYGKGNFQFDSVTIPHYNTFLVGDFDGDGIPDIVTSTGVFFGEGSSRTFTAPTGIVPGLEDYNTYVVADMNGDGKDDLVLGGGPEIYLSIGRQGFEADQVLVLNGYFPTVSSMTVADFNGDGLLDIAVGMSSADDLVLFTNDGTGKFQVTTYAIGVLSVLSVSADFNRDGRPDLAFRGYLTLFEPPTVTVLLHQ